MAVNRGPRITNDSLVLCLDAADRNSYPGSGSILYDISGNAYNATFQGSAYSDGFVVILGTSNYLQISDASDLRGTVEKTINVWLKLDSYTSPGTIFCKRSDTSNNDYFIFLYSGNTIWWDYGVGGRVDTGYVPPLNEWLNLAFVRNASSRFLYVNGSLETTLSAGAVSTTTSSLLIGRNTTAANYYINGSVGPTYIYNRALSSAEVISNFNATRKRFGV